MNRDPDERAHSDDVPADREFEAIVAGWRREGRVPSWPDDVSGLAGPGLFEPAPGGPGVVDPGSSDPRGLDPGPLDPASGPPLTPPEEEHFVPPEPPPLPPVAPPVLVGLALVGAGLLLLVSPGWLGVSESYGLPLGLVAIAAGLGWLVLRLWPDPPESGEHCRPDDGAVL